MNERDTGGWAFPSHGSMGEVAYEGMTLRAYIAAKALANMAVVHSPSGYDYSKPEIAPQAAKAAVAYADALLKELSK